MRLFVSLAAAAIVVGSCGAQPDTSVSASSHGPSVASIAPPPATEVLPNTTPTGTLGPLPVDRLPTTGWILFSSDARRVSTVGRVGPNGMEAAEILSGSHPDWSPDGQAIAFSCVTDPSAEPETLGTCLSRADGSGKTTLIQEGYGAKFSPDGARLAYLRGVIDTSDVLVADLRAPAEGQVIGQSGTVDWSPDSERLLLRVEAGRQTIVSRDGRLLHEISGYGGAWSPDGSKVAHFRVVGSHTHLLLADATNGTITASGFETERAPEGIVWIAGDRLLFLMDGDLWRLDLAAPTEPARLTADLGIDWPMLSLSPDGEWVAFTKTEAAGAGLYVASVEGGWSQIVTAIQLRYPAWQPAP
jgi:Tol biopolymer transport system component